jgi:hypothetical protein
VNVEKNWPDRVKSIDLRSIEYDIVLERRKKHDVPGSLGIIEVSPIFIRISTCYLHHFPIFGENKSIPFIDLLSKTKTLVNFSH